MLFGNVRLLMLFNLDCSSKLQVQQNQMIGKEAEKRFGIKKVASTKIVTCQKGIISRDKGAQSTGNVQKNGSKKLISLKVRYFIFSCFVFYLNFSLDMLKGAKKENAPLFLDQKEVNIG